MTSPSFSTFDIFHEFLSLANSNSELYWAGIFIVSYCVTNFLSLSSLKQHMYYLTISVNHKDWNDVAGSSTSEFHKAAVNRLAGATVSSHCLTGEEPFPEFLCSLAEVSFLLTGGQRSLNLLFGPLCRVTHSIVACFVKARL